MYLVENGVFAPKAWDKLSNRFDMKHEYVFCGCFAWLESAAARMLSNFDKRR